MPDYSTISLKTVDFRPSEFRPTQYTVEAPDANILQRSLAQAEARQKEAIKQQSAIDATLGQIESNLHNDEQTSSWFAEYKDNIKRQIQGAIDVGDYTRATNIATQLAGQVTSDSQILGRMEANTEYKKKLDTVENLKLQGKIGQTTYNWWLANNPYRYIEPTNQDGTINTDVRGTLAETNLPLADVNWLGVVDNAFKAVSPSSVSRESSTSTHKADGSGSSSGSSSGVRQVKVEDILANYETIFKDPNLRAQVSQAYNVAMYDYQNLQVKYNSGTLTDSELDDYNNAVKLLMKNGSPVTEQEYAARMVTTFANNMAYRHTTSGNSSSTTEAPEKTVTTPAGGNYSTGFFNGAVNPYGATWSGPGVLSYPNYNPYGVTLPAFNIGTRFGF